MSGNVFTYTSLSSEEADPVSPVWRSNTASCMVEEEVSLFGTLCASIDC